jgi:transketolase
MRPLTAKRDIVETPSRVRRLGRALTAADQLKEDGITVRVLDLYCVKPPDGNALAAEIGATAGRLVTVRDHWPEGGLGEGVLHAIVAAGAAPVKFKLVAVNGLPHSGKPDELVDEFGISARHAVEAVRGVL